MNQRTLSEVDDDTEAHGFIENANEAFDDDDEDSPGQGFTENANEAVEEA